MIMKLKCKKNFKIERLYAGGGNYQLSNNFYKDDIYDIIKFGESDIVKGRGNQLYITIEYLKEKCINFNEYFEIIK